MSANKHYDGFVRMEVVALAVDPSINSPIVVLKSRECDLCLPIWLGLSEMSAIAVALKQVEIKRPLTHDLMGQLMELSKVEVRKVSIVGLVDETYFAEIEIKIGKKIRLLDSRPSDAIAIALRNNLAIHVCTNVLSKTKGIMESISFDTEEVGEGDDLLLEQSYADLIEVELLNKDDSSKSEDQDTELRYGTKAIESFSEKEWFDCFENMNPSDFKYKM